MYRSDSYRRPFAARQSTGPCLILAVSVAAVLFATPASAQTYGLAVQSWSPSSTYAYATDAYGDIEQWAFTDINHMITSWDQDHTTGNVPSISGSTPIPVNVLTYMESIDAGNGADFDDPGLSELSLGSTTTYVVTEAPLTTSPETRTLNLTLYLTASENVSNDDQDMASNLDNDYDAGLMSSAQAFAYAEWRDESGIIVNTPTPAEWADSGTPDDSENFTSASWSSSPSASYSISVTFTNTTVNGTAVSQATFSLTNLAEAYTKLSESGNDLVSQAQASASLTLDSID